jgi:hypothetical protein
LRTCLDQLRLTDRQGGRLNFNHMLCCCHHRGAPTQTVVS